MDVRAPQIALAAALLTLAAGAASAQRRHLLADFEEDKVREAQDPSERIKVYLEITQERLDRFQDFRTRQDNPRYDYGRYLDELLDEYISINEEIKNWIEHQYSREADMRRGLRALLEVGPQQLAFLRGVRESPDPHTPRYEPTLLEAIEHLSDTLDGATLALAEQEKQFKDLELEEEEMKRLAKEHAKEEKKRTKEEKKVRKSEGKRRAPGEIED